MKLTAYVAIALLTAAPLLSHAKEPSMKFWFRGQEPGEAAHQVLPYRIGNTMMIVVYDPVVCGQTPDRPRFSVRPDRLILQYDLTEAPADKPQRSCMGISIFQVEDLPERPLQVGFAGGAEPFSVTQLKRCPSERKKTHEWDCLVPSRQDG